MSVNKKTGLRLLTLREIALAKTVFRDAIQYHKVWIHYGGYLPFGLQHADVAMTPNGEIYFENNYREDFANEIFTLQHLFIHEMTHVWQYQRGMWVKARGMFGWALSYKYALDHRQLGAYPMEQQAQIVADYFVLNRFGFQAWLNGLGNNITFEGDAHPGTIEMLYRKTLSNFPYG